MAAPSSSRFANLDDEEYELLLQDKDTVNTKKSTKTAVIIFRDYLSDKGQNIDFHVLTKTKSELASLLEAKHESEWPVEARRTG